MSEQKKRVLSCIQPTGHMHFGNYFGAVKNWVDLQEQHECFYGVVDYHAMTMPYDPKKLRNSTWELIFNLMAVGIQPECLFIQSLVPEHTELGWIFNNFATFAEVYKQPQFKDKRESLASSGEDYVSVGLFDYPVLQASDILIYKADIVPVGEDQRQHLELTREIAQRFNSRVGKEYFVLPKALYTPTPKIRSTADPTRKMSKSAGEKHYINVFEEEKKLRKQIGSAVTDTGEDATGEMSAGVANLFELMKAAGKVEAHNELLQHYQEGKLMYKDLKQTVADALVEIAANFRANRKALDTNKKVVKEQIKASSATIRKQAQRTLQEVKELAGLQNIRF